MINIIVQTWGGSPWPVPEWLFIICMQNFQWMTSCIACCSAVVIASSFKLGKHAILTRHEGTQISSAGKIVYSLDRWHFVRSDSLPKLCDCEAPFDSLEEPIDWLRKCLGFRENTSKKDCSDGSPSRQRSWNLTTLETTLLQEATWHQSLLSGCLLVSKPPYSLQARHRWCCLLAEIRWGISIKGLGHG